MMKTSHRTRWMQAITAALALTGCARGLEGDDGETCYSPPDVAPDAGGGDAGAVAAEPSHKRVFITSTAYDGNLAALAPDGDPLAAADGLCTDAAASESLGGVWRAWLSLNAPGAAAVNAIDRIADVGPWYSVDGKKLVFHNKANLATVPVNWVLLDERGEAAPTSFAWTGTKSGGIASDDCDQWGSGPTGINDQYMSIANGRLGIGEASHWTDFDALPCDRKFALYCLEQ